MIFIFPLKLNTFHISYKEVPVSKNIATTMGNVKQILFPILQHAFVQLDLQMQIVYQVCILKMHDQLSITPKHQQSNFNGQKVSFNKNIK